MRCSLILLTFGYVEDAQVSTLILKAPNPYGTAIEGLHNLASALMQEYAREREPGLSECCTAFKTHLADPAVRIAARWCPCCRTPLNTDWDVETWKAWLHDLGHKTSVEWPHELEYETDWTPWASAAEIFSTPRDAILVIAEHGEDVLTKALRGDELDDPRYAAMIKEQWQWYTKRARDLGRQDYDRAAFAQDLDSSSDNDFQRHRLNL
jgi:hypothetical protein